MHLKPKHLRMLASGAMLGRCALAIILLAIIPGCGKDSTATSSDTQASADLVAPKVWQDVKIDQNLGLQVPGDLVFRDERGQSVRLDQYYGRKPIILTVVYYECPMLCTQVLTGLLHSIQSIRLQLGQDYEIVTVSFDPKEGPELAAKKKQGYAKRYLRDGAAEGWHFLTGSQESIDRLTKTIGFNYKYDEVSQQYAHASGIMMLTPEGKLSRYFYGIQYPPRDVELGLVESSNNKIGSPVHQFLLLCFHYDPLTGKYGLAISRMLTAGGLLTVLSLGIFISRSLWLERRARRATASATPAA